MHLHFLSLDVAKQLSHSPGIALPLGLAGGKTSAGLTWRWRRQQQTTAPMRGNTTLSSGKCGADCHKNRCEVDSCFSATTAAQDTAPFEHCFRSLQCFKKLYFVFACPASAKTFRLQCGHKASYAEFSRFTATTISFCLLG